MTKPTLVLLPGLLNDARLWDHQKAALADMAEVMVLDTSVADSVGALADHVLQAAPERFCLAGLSMGGYTSMEIMRRAPGRVERLALVSTTARPDIPEQTQRRLDAIALARAGGFDKIMPMMLPNLVHPDHLGEHPVAVLSRDMARVIGIEGFVRQQTAIIGRPDSRLSLPAVTCPTLVVCGRQDTLTPPDRAEEMAGLIPGARLVMIEECGHLSAIEQPQAVSAVLSYWLQG